MEAYYSCGRTKVLYAASRKPVCLVLMFLIDLLAFELILLTCVKIKIDGQVDTKVPN